MPVGRLDREGALDAGKTLPCAPAPMARRHRGVVDPRYCVRLVHQHPVAFVTRVVADIMVLPRVMRGRRWLLRSGLRYRGAAARPRPVHKADAALSVSARAAAANMVIFITDILGSGANLAVFTIPAGSHDPVRRVIPGGETSRARIDPPPPDLLPIAFLWEHPR